MEHPHDQRLLLFRALAQERRDEHRHEGQRRDERPAESEQHRDRHRLEHLPLDPSEREDRDIDEDDDRLAKQGGAPDVERGAEYHVGRLAVGHRTAAAASRRREVHDRVLHDDDRPVDDDAEVDRAEAHQVATEPERLHADEGDEHGEGDRGRDDQPAANASEQQEQHRDDEERALREVRRHRLDGPIDQSAAVVEDIEPHAWGQRGLDLRDPRLDVFDDFAPIGADEHHDDAGDDLAAPVPGHGTLADQRREVDAADVPDPHRDAVLAGLDQHVADLLEALDPALAADQQLLTGTDEVAAAGGRVVALERDEELAQGDVQGAQPIGQDLDLVGLELSAEGVDLDHAGHASDLVGDEPVEDHPQLHRRVTGFGVGLAGRAHRLGTDLEL